MHMKNKLVYLFVKIAKIYLAATSKCKLYKANKPYLGHTVDFR